MAAADIERRFPILQRMIGTGLVQKRYSRIHGELQRKPGSICVISRNHGDPGRRIIPIQQSQQKHGVSDGVLCSLPRQEVQLELCITLKLLIFRELCQPHQIPSHQPVAAGNGTIVCFLGSQDHRFMIAPIEVVAA